MKQSIFCGALEIFPGNDVIRRFTFKTSNLRDSYALLAKENRQLAMNSAPLWEQSAHLRKRDCFESLSPRIQESERAKITRSKRIAA
jgi:hypothetical protein